MYVSYLTMLILRFEDSETRALTVHQLLLSVSCTTTQVQFHQITFLTIQTSMSTPHRPDTVSNHGAVVLRNSCDACTEVKMACSRGKPTCARCARRGEVCVYGPMKRAGRKKQQPESSCLQRQPPRKVGPGARRRSSSTRVQLPSPSTTTDTANRSGSTSSHNSLGFDLSANASENTLDTYTFTVPASSRSAPNEAENCPTVTKGRQTQETLMSGIEDSNDTVAASVGTDINVFTPPSAGMGVFDDQDWMMMSPLLFQGGVNAYPPSDTSAIQGGFVFDFESTQGLPESLLPESCLTTALGVLGALTPSLDMCPGLPSMDSTNHPQDGPAKNRRLSNFGSLTGFEQVMQRNGASIRSIGLILKCPCAMDSGIILILAHIIFQILAWYGAAARVPYAEKCLTLGQWTQLPQVPPPCRAEDDVAEEEAQDRFACQTVLSEMHSVRTLVEGLSQIILREGEIAAHSRCKGNNLKHTGNHNAQPPSALAFSLVTELSDCLRDVSRAIVARLAEV
jgi:hypothetical protein